MAAGTCRSRVSAGKAENSMELEQREKMCKKIIKQEPECENNNTDEVQLSPNSDVFSSMRRNKRKMSEPKRRSDFSVKRLCSTAGGSDGDQAGSSEPDSPASRGEGSVADDRTQVEDKVKYAAHFAPTLPSRELLIPNIYHRLPLVYDPAQRLALHGGPVPEPQPVGPHSRDPNQGQKRTRKNYKNMTRERRVEANARERTRVHTISAAFESLRRAVPSYSYNQKLSKLAILKIASSYILALSRLAEMDSTQTPSTSQNRPTFAECVDMCTQTIQTEGRIRRRH